MLIIIIHSTKLCHLLDLIVRTKIEYSHLITGMYCIKFQRESQWVLTWRLALTEDLTSPMVLPLIRPTFLVILGARLYPSALATLHHNFITLLAVLFNKLLALVKAFVTIEHTSRIVLQAHCPPRNLIDTGSLHEQLFNSTMASIRKLRWFYKLTIPPCKQYCIKGILLGFSQHDVSRLDAPEA